MGILATGNITLTPVNDGCSISLSRSSCTVKAAFDGSSPDLSQAYTDISLVRGDTKLPITGANLSVSVPEGVEYTVTTTDTTTQRITITVLPVSLSSCEVKISLSYYDFSASVIFSMTTVRETSMLDWILDWEENKTEIGSAYILTPKIYAGTVTEGENGGVNVNGVYIGPDPTKGAGVYGYKDGHEIFRLNSTGGQIAGWNIAATGISTSDGLLQILSEGTVKSISDDGSIMWGLYKDGTATFAKGKVQFNSDGSAVYEGKIASSSGKIGNWDIKPGYMSNAHVLLHSDSSIIGISNAEITEDNVGSFLDLIKANGGIAMYYGSASNEFKAYLPDSKEVFSLGSVNSIAGWKFDTDALYLGTKTNILGSCTAASGDITIGSFGIRGYGWRIESNGEFSFADGRISYEGTTAKIAGWELGDESMYGQNIVFVGGNDKAGLYLSDSDIAGHSGSEMESLIRSSSGIYLRHAQNKGAEIYAGSGGVELFRVTATKDKDSLSGYICGWNFSPTGLHCGTGALVDAGAFTSSEGAIFIGQNGLRGYAWRIESDGSGAVAKGNLRWDNQGRLFIGPESSPGTTVTDATILTETIMVQNSKSYIGAGISADGNEDGSIRFWAGSSFENRADAPFCVKQDGSVTMTKAKVTGEINASSGAIGGFEIDSGRIGSNGTADSVNGLSLYNSGIYLRDNGEDAEDTKVFVGLGNALPAIAGVKCAARFELQNNSAGDGSIALLAKYQVSDSRGELSYRPLAFKRVGNELSIGKTCRYDTGYIGKANSNTLVDWFAVTHTFVFTSISVENLAMYLPSSDSVNEALQDDGVSVVTFNIRIIVASSISNKITLMPPRKVLTDSSTENGEIYEHDNAVKSISLNEKDVIDLQYYAGNWYVASRNWNYS